MAEPLKPDTESSSSSSPAAVPVARLHSKSGLLEDIALKDMALIAVVAIALIVAAFWIAFRFVRPAPPDHFVISTGAAGGAYDLFGKRYSEQLAREKIQVEARSSSGSLENLSRLNDDNSNVDVGFAQGGTGNAERSPHLVTLAAIYYEPVWIFYRGSTELNRISQLEGKRIAIGPAGSGTRALAMSLVEASSEPSAKVLTSELGNMEAAQALMSGRVDAALFVASSDAPLIQQLLRMPGVRLMNLSQAEALSRRFPYLSTVTLPRGMIDLANDVPATDVKLIATTAYLVARDDFHPALISVLLQAASHIHNSAGVFQKTGEFPAAREGDFPMSEDAQRYFKSGPPFLQRYMPFWVANLLERLLVLLVPLVAVMIPVMRLLPGIYQWRVRSRVFRWYRELKSIEADLETDASPTHLAYLLARINLVDEGADRTNVPLQYSDYLYNLKSHIQLTRIKLTRMLADAANPNDQTAAPSA